MLSAGSVSRTSDMQATISFTTNEAGTAYYLIVNSGTTAPAKAAVRAGTSLGRVSAGAVSSKSVALIAGSKNIYIVVEDSSGNISNLLKNETGHYTNINRSLKMQDTELLIEEIRTLPDDYRACALDFVGYLKEKALKRQEGCPICAKHRDPVTGELRFNAETMAGMREVEDMISGKIPVKWHTSLEDLNEMLEL